MTIRDLTDKQLERIWERLLSRVTRDVFGADWRTLYQTDRALYRSLKDVAIETTYRREVGR